VPAARKRIEMTEKSPYCESWSLERDARDLSTQTTCHLPLSSCNSPCFARRVSALLTWPNSCCFLRRRNTRVHTRYVSVSTASANRVSRSGRQISLGIYETSGDTSASKSPLKISSLVTWPLVQTSGRRQPLWRYELAFLD